MTIVALQPSTNSRLWERIALIAWCAVLLFVSVRVFIDPVRKTVYPIFSASARLWWDGGELYEPDRPKDVQSGFRYCPTCAVAFTPFAIFPDSLGGIFWRLFNVAALFGSLLWFVRALLPNLLSSRHLAWLALLVMPMTLQSANNGQANLLVIACMLGAVAAIAEERWNLCSILIAGAFVLKLYPLALGMVLILLYPRRLSWRIPLACGVSMLVPFCFQWPGYVIDQYAKWVAVLRSDDRADIVMEHMYRDLWLLIHVYGLPVSRKAYLLIQLAGGGLVALMAWRRQRADWPTSELLVSTLALTTAWMMLLGPATESSSFAILAPSFAISIVDAIHRKETGMRRYLLWASCACFTLAVLSGGFMLTVVAHTFGVHVWGSMFYFVYLLTQPRPLLAQNQTLSIGDKLGMAA